MVSVIIELDDPALYKIFRTSVPVPAVLRLYFLLFQCCRSGPICPAGFVLLQSNDFYVR